MDECTIYEQYFHYNVMEQNERHIVGVKRRATRTEAEEVDSRMVCTPPCAMHPGMSTLPQGTFLI